MKISRPLLYTAVKKILIISLTNNDGLPHLQDSYFPKHNALNMTNQTLENGWLSETLKDHVEEMASNESQSTICWSQHCSDEPKKI